MNRPVGLALALTLVVGAGAACSREEAGRADAASSAIDPATAARTSLPGLEPPDPTAIPPGLVQARPTPGTIARVPGPFDERFELDRLALRAGVVSGRLRVTSDVSELIELEVVAGFYDDRGRLLGTGKMVHHLDEGTEPHAEGPPGEVEVFRIPAPRRFAGDVEAAALTVPVLVNE